MAMLDREDKKTLVNTPYSDKYYNWEKLWKELYEPCFVWPEGPIYSDQNIRIMASNLVELIDSISYFELTSFETPDIKDFIKAYDTVIAMLGSGPGNPNTIRTTIFKPKKKIHETFAEQAKHTLEAFEKSLQLVEDHSLQAQDNHANRLDIDIEGPGPQVRSGICLDDDGIHSLNNLRLIAKGKPILPIPPNCPRNPKTNAVEIHNQDLLRTIDLAS